MTEPNYDDMKGNYIARTDLLSVRKWGRLKIEQLLGTPDLVCHGEALYQRAYVLIWEQSTPAAERADDPIEEAFTKMIDEQEIELRHLDASFFFSAGMLVGMPLQGMLQAGLTAGFEDRYVEDIGREVLLDMLMRSHSNHDQIQNVLREAGFEGRDVRFYLAARLKRAWVSELPWLTETARSNVT